MAKLKEIVENKEILLHFKNAVLTEKVSHAYILNGAKGTGKSLLANYFSTLLQCEKGGSEPCGECHSCRQAATDNQPDIIWVRHEKPATISVDDIREQVNNDITIKPYSSRYKIYIIDEAELMTVQAQNALLKTIEEPPEYAIIILLTNNAAGFLPTVLSRCVTLKIKPINTEVIKEYLKKEFKIPDIVAGMSAGLAYGNLGKAIRFANADNISEVKRELVVTITHIEQMDVYEVMAAVKRAEAFKLEISDYLDLMVAWFRDVLLYKASKEISELVFKEEINTIKLQATKASYEGIGEMIASIEQTKIRLKANVNFDLAIELMYLTIKENLK